MMALTKQAQPYYDEGADFAAAQPSFQWKPLQDSRHEIRILTLLPGHGQQPIECALQHVTLDAAVGKYEALSYAWGKPDFDGNISVNGADFRTTASLHGALGALRLQDKPRYLWTDAVCINQKSVVERNDQVRRMHDIYKSASRCLVWLGKSPLNGSDPFHALRHLAELVGGMVQDEYFDRQRLLRQVDWQGNAWLFTRQWFFRKWVFQEAALASEVLMLCGTFACPWEVFRPLEMLDSVVGQEFSLTVTQCLAGGWEDPAYRGLTNALSITSYRENVEVTTFCDIIFTGVYFDCSDPRDCIFALLNLASSYGPGRQGMRKRLPVWHLKQIFPDYSLTLNQVNHITTKFLLETSGLFWLSWVSGEIGSCGDQPSADVSRQRPSWVLLSFGHEQDRPDLEHLLGQEYSHFKAGTPHTLPHPWGFLRTDVDEALAAQLLTPFSFHTSDRILVLHGRFFGIIETLLEPRSDPSTLRNVSTIEWLRECELAACAHFGKGRDVLDAFMRLVTCWTTRDALDIDLPTLQLALQSEGTTRKGDDGDGGSPTVLPHRAEAAAMRCRNFASARRFCITSTGRMGLVPITARRGDAVCVTLGVNVPLVVRQCDSGRHCKLLGESYVTGLMGGEGWTGDDYARAGRNGQSFDPASWGQSIEIC